VTHMAQHLKLAPVAHEGLLAADTLAETHTNATNFPGKPQKATAVRASN
jgi:hypothetical protein